jgi:Transient receptor potential (TRP) ion channel
MSGSSNTGPNSVPRLAGTRSPGFSATKEIDANATVPEENKSLNGHSVLSPSIIRTSSRFGLPLSTSSDRGVGSHRPWWKFRSDIGAFHGSILHGNLVRILVLFHLPVTIFSCYQMTLPRSQTSLSSIVLAAFSFTFLSILIPAHLVLRVTFTPTNKLYDETRTLLALGPLYNHYRHGSQMFASMLFATNIVFGITIGAGQKSGITQAIIILVVEVISALVTSIWLPWGSGASMGLISFLFCVARIVIAVLLVILTPTVSSLVPFLSN